MSVPGRRQGLSSSGKSETVWVSLRPTKNKILAHTSVHVDVCDWLSISLVDRLAVDIDSRSFDCRVGGAESSWSLFA